MIDGIAGLFRACGGWVTPHAFTRAIEAESNLPGESFVLEPMEDLQSLRGLNWVGREHGKEPMASLALRIGLKQAVAVEGAYRLCDELRALTPRVPFLLLRVGVVQFQTAISDACLNPLRQRLGYGD